MIANNYVEYDDTFVNEDKVIEYFWEWFVALGLLAVWQTTNFDRLMLLLVTNLHFLNQFEYYGNLLF